MFFMGNITKYYRNNRRKSVKLHRATGKDFSLFLSVALKKTIPLRWDEKERFGFPLTSLVKKEALCSSCKVET